MEFNNLFKLTQLPFIFFYVPSAWGKAFETIIFGDYLGAFTVYGQQNIFVSRTWKHFVYIKEKRKLTNKELSFCNFIRY